MKDFLWKLFVITFITANLPILTSLRNEAFCSSSAAWRIKRQSELPRHNVCIAKLSNLWCIFVVYLVVNTLVAAPIIASLSHSRMYVVCWYAIVWHAQNVLFTMASCC